MEVVPQVPWGRPLQLYRLELKEKAEARSEWTTLRVPPLDDLWEQKSECFVGSRLAARHLAKENSQSISRLIWEGDSKAPPPAPVLEGRASSC